MYCKLASLLQVYDLDIFRLRGKKNIKASMFVAEINQGGK